MIFHINDCVCWIDEHDDGAFDVTERRSPFCGHARLWPITEIVRSEMPGCFMAAISWEAEL